MSTCKTSCEGGGAWRRYKQKSWFLKKWCSCDFLPNIIQRKLLHFSSSIFYEAYSSRQGKGEDRVKKWIRIKNAVSKWTQIVVRADASLLVKSQSVQISLVRRVSFYCLQLAHFHFVSCEQCKRMILSLLLCDCVSNIKLENSFRYCLELVYKASYQEITSALYILPSGCMLER